LVDKPVRHAGETPAHRAPFIIGHAGRMLDEIRERQHGVITRRQALAGGPML
jgi:hypothetical protein